MSIFQGGLGHSDGRNVQDRRQKQRWRADQVAAQMPTWCTTVRSGRAYKANTDQKFWLNPILREEFVAGMLEHPVTSKILRIKKIDAILDTMWWELRTKYMYIGRIFLMRESRHKEAVFLLNIAKTESVG